MILALITVGKMLEARSKGKTTDALKGLMKLAPKTATVLVDGEERTVPVTDVQVGDVFVVRSGEAVPVDGVVLDGACAVDESSLTGESIPVDKTAEDAVWAATINRSGFVRCKATRVGADTTLSQIKMFLTRMGRNARFIVTGDVTQIDLPKKSDSGLVRAMSILREVSGIGMVEFDRRDIVRHELVKQIVAAFDRASDPSTSPNHNE